MASITPRPWKVVDELIEQPSWGGRYIVDLKGLASDPAWAGKKVGQSYELAKTSRLIDPATGEASALADVIASDPEGVLGKGVVAKYGSDISLLIKLTQAKGNSFQVHLPEGKALGHWLPKPEAWFYLAPGLYTFGLSMERSFEEFANALVEIDVEMRRLSDEAVAGKISVNKARAVAREFIAARNPYQYINMIKAHTDDIVDLTAGGIHHSWEEDSDRYPDGNLVYEVQIDVQDEYCSMRGFDKGKFLDDGKLRATHVADYLATIEQDSYHNDLRLHIKKPLIVGEAFGARTESVFRTPYFWLDRITLGENASSVQSSNLEFHHLFVFDGMLKIGDDTLGKGESYLIPGSVGWYRMSASHGAVVFKTYLPVEPNWDVTQDAITAADPQDWPHPAAHPPATEVRLY